MKTTVFFRLLPLLALLAACSNLERSRDLSNPLVSPAVTAAQVCSLCHGLDGNSTSPNIPRLAGQQETYLISQLTSYRSHSRSDPAGFEYMWGLSKNLSDEQISGLARYFAEQKPLKNEASDAPLAAAGKLIYENGLLDKEVPPCMACHGPHGEGMATFPRLAFQHQDYVIKQLQVFQRTDERPNTPMTQVAHLLSEQEMRAVASYLQSFPEDGAAAEQQAQ